ncbi:hypothetical protein FRC05_011627 [Tulasnella sp. 425]|nr:hypothetical protein FRC05_011627 [Tulasnella sp. 425]
MSLWTMSVNPNAPAQPGGQPSSGRGQGQQNQARGNIGGGGRGAGRGGGRGRGRSRNDEDTSDRLSIRSGPSVKTIGSSGDRGLRTYYFDPCNCSVRTKVTPTTAYCPVCNAGCTQVFVEKDGKFIDFLAEDGAIDEEPSTEDAEPPQPQSSVPQPAPSFSPPAPSPPAQVAPSPPARVVPSPPAQVAPTPQPAPPSEDEGQQMIEVRNAQPASLMSRVTVRRLPNPPKPIGPRPAPDHSMDIDFPDGMDEIEAQVESPTETRPVGTSGYGQESVQPLTKPAFRDEDSLPFARRGSPMPPHETRTTASPTSPVDPFVQPSSVDSYELEVEDMAPAPVTPASQLPPQGYRAPHPQADPFDDSAAAETSQPAPEAHPVVQEVVKENKSNSLPVPSQWEGYGGGPSANLNRASAFSASSGTQRAASDPAELSPYASDSGNTALPNGGSSGFRYPEGGYELRGSKPQSNQLHQRNNSDGLHSRNNSDNLHQRNNSDGPYGRTVQGGLQPPSSLLNPVDLPPPSPTSPGVNNNPPTSARWNPPPGPPPNHFLSAPATTMPNGTGSGRRTPSPTRSRPTSATGTRPVKISEKQHEPHFGLSNLSYTPINYPDPNTALDKQYPTPEHLFQAMKFMGHKPLIAEHIRTCGGNPKPRDEARRFAYEQDPSWATTCLERMYEVLQLKFKAYPGLEAELLDTGEADLVLDSSDAFWGCGADGRGQNQLGSLLMRLRVELVEALSRQFDQSGLSN